ncbi:MAG: hypothetical protein HC913_19165 [Microscillaceae bacterium]|nr:hypothetical protein [Microscillaceae bacterium]
MGFLEIGKLVKSLAEYKDIQEQRFKAEIENQKSSVFLYLIMAIFALLFLLFVFITLAFWMATFFGNAAWKGFLAVTIFQVSVMLGAAAILRLKSQKTKKKRRLAQAQSQALPQNQPL